MNEASYRNEPLSAFGEFKSENLELNTLLWISVFLFSIVFIYDF